MTETDVKSRGWNCAGCGVW